MNIQYLIVSQDVKMSPRSTCYSVKARAGATRRHSADRHTQIWSAWGTWMRTSSCRIWCCRIWGRIRGREFWCSSACLKMISDGRITAAPWPDTGPSASLTAAELVLRTVSQAVTNGPMRTVTKQDRSSAKTVSCFYVTFWSKSPWNRSSRKSRCRAGPGSVHQLLMWCWDVGVPLKNAEAGLKWGGFCNFTWISSQRYGV